MMCMHSNLRAGEIVSNICVYKTQLFFRSQRHLALSLGGCGDEKEFRKQGLSRSLMEHLSAKYEGVKTLVIAWQTWTTLALKGVFSLQHIQFADLCQQLPFSNVECLEFGFVPPWPDLQTVWEEFEGSLLRPGINL